METQAAGHDHGKEHSHPTPATYGKVAAVLFILTALEVMSYEIGRKPSYSLHAIVEPIVVEILLVLSAIKFALVGAFYMHLKQDSKIFTNLFVMPILIAGVIILALIALHGYWVGVKV